MAKMRWIGDLGKETAKDIAKGNFDDSNTNHAINLKGAQHLPPELQKHLADLDEKLRTIGEISLHEKRKNLILKMTDLSAEEAERVLQEEA